MDELERLVDTAGGDVVARVVQERSAPDPATYVGEGPSKEIGEAAGRGGGLVVFDDELTPGPGPEPREAVGREFRVDRPA